MTELNADAVARLLAASISHGALSLTKVRNVPVNEGKDPTLVVSEIMLKHCRVEQGPKPTTPRRFVTEDWYGFAGAENFKDGSVPFMLETDRFCVVGDSTGISYFDPEDLGGGWTLQLGTITPLLAEVLLADLAKRLSSVLDVPHIGKEALPAALKELGFERA